MIDNLRMFSPQTSATFVRTVPDIFSTIIGHDDENFNTMNIFLAPVLVKAIASFFAVCNFYKNSIPDYKAPVQSITKKLNVCEAWYVRLHFYSNLAEHFISTKAY